MPHTSPWRLDETSADPRSAVLVQASRWGACSEQLPFRVVAALGLGAHLRERPRGDDTTVRSDQQRRAVAPTEIATVERLIYHTNVTRLDHVPVGVDARQGIREREHRPNVRKRQTKQLERPGQEPRLTVTRHVVEEDEAPELDTRDAQPLREDRGCRRHTEDRDPDEDAHPIQADAKPGRGETVGVMMCFDERARRVVAGDRFDTVLRRVDRLAAGTIAILPVEPALTEGHRDLPVNVASSD